MEFLRLQAALRAWEDEYYLLRQHQALGYQTSAEILPGLSVRGLSRTC